MAIDSPTTATRGAKVASGAAEARITSPALSHPFGRYALGKAVVLEHTFVYNLGLSPGGREVNRTSYTGGNSEGRAIAD
jgi:hypothetical protein